MKPVYIDGCYGVLHPADGERGVVICGPLGEEALNSYRSQVFLAERLAASGFPTLRISYYGTGDSAGDDEEPDRFRAWIDSIVAAALWLRSACGVSSVSLCGLRIGAALAARAAQELGDIDALAMLAPVASGRRFLREQILAARTVAEIWQSVSLTDDERWFEAYGLRLDRATRDALDRLDVTKLGRLPVQRILLIDQPKAPGIERLAERLGASDVAVTLEHCEHCNRLLRDSHEAEVPHAAFTRIVAWLGDAGTSGRTPAQPVTVSLDIGSVHEVPVRLGPADLLAGILALPAQCDAESPVVLVPSTGANPRFGNSRGTVALTRWLAEHGIASLRMDGHGTGDSAPETGERGLPYSKQGDEDVRSGVDFLVTRFSGPIIVLGMCSGAYHAFQAALDDQRISGLMLVNLQKFVWQDGESLSVVQRTTFRTTGFYLRNITNPTVWRRLLHGQVNAAGIAGALANRAFRHLAAVADPAIAAVRGETPVGMVRRQWVELAQRSVQILYVLSGNDPGLDEISEYFGLRGWRLRRSPNVMFRKMPGADHTLSTHWARRRLRQSIALYLRQRYGVAMPVEETDGHQARARVREAPVLSTALPHEPGTIPGRVIDSAPTAA